MLIKCSLTKEYVSEEKCKEIREENNCPYIGCSNHPIYAGMGGLKDES